MVLLFHRPLLLTGSLYFEFHGGFGGEVGLLVLLFGDSPLISRQEVDWLLRLRPLLLVHFEPVLPFLHMDEPWICLLGLGGDKVLRPREGSLLLAVFSIFFALHFHVLYLFLPRFLPFSPRLKQVLHSGHVFLKRHLVPLHHFSGLLKLLLLQFPFFFSHSLKPGA